MVPCQLHSSPTGPQAIVQLDKLQLIMRDSGDKQFNVLETMQKQNKELQSTLTDLHRSFPHPTDKDPYFSAWSGDTSKVLLWLYQIEEIYKSKKLSDEVAREERNHSFHTLFT